MRRREFILLGGATVAWPLAVRAQTPTPVVGFMSGRAPEESARLVAAFREGLADSGFVEGQNVAIEFRWAYGDYDRLQALATDLVSRGVAVLVGVGGDVSAVAATKATKTIPVVFGIGGDPVKAGMVASFKHPGGNVTGFTLWTNETESKRLGLLRELVPGVPLIGILVNPQFRPTVQELEDIEPAAKSVNQQLFVGRANNDANWMQRSPRSCNSVSVRFLSPPLLSSTRGAIELSAMRRQHRLPAIYQFREFAVAGGLISYGPNIAESYKNAGVYVGRILKGEKPADLPVLQQTKFDFVINLKTAKALGLTVPPTLLIEAGEVISAIGTKRR